MAVLDLQGMENMAPATGGDGGHHSASSGHSCDASNLSVLICEGHSVLSLALC